MLLCRERADGQSIFCRFLPVTVKRKWLVVAGLQKIKSVIFPSLPEALKSQINFSLAWVELLAPRGSLWLGY